MKTMALVLKIALVSLALGASSVLTSCGPNGAQQAAGMAGAAARAGAAGAQQGGAAPALRLPQPDYVETQGYGNDPSIQIDYQ